MIAAAPVFSARRASRRVSTRRAIAIPCQVVREHDFRLVAERTLDVSVEGMLVPLDRSLAEDVRTGDAVIVSFEIQGLWIDAEGTVSRIVHGRRPCDEGPACGIELEVMSHTCRAALAGVLHGRPPPLPRRGPLARLRRGLEVPRLADQAMMETFPPLPVVEIADEDVLDDEDEALEILREVAAAWKRLLAPSGPQDSRADARYAPSETCPRTARSD